MKIIPVCNYLYLIILQCIKTKDHSLLLLLIYTVYFFVNLLNMISLNYYFINFN